MTRMKQILTMVAAAALVVVALPMTAAAQVPSSDAAAFMGNWEIPLDTPQGAVTVELMVKDDGGKVAAAIGMQPVIPEPVAVTDISTSAGALVLKYSLDVQGMQIPTTLSLIPEGGAVKASFDFMQGQFVIDGVAKKK